MCAFFFENIGHQAGKKIQSLRMEVHKLLSSLLLQKSTDENQAEQLQIRIRRTVHGSNEGEHRMNILFENSLIGNMANKRKLYIVGIKNSIIL